MQEEGRGRQHAGGDAYADHQLHFLGSWPTLVHFISIPYRLPEKKSNKNRTFPLQNVKFLKAPWDGCSALIYNGTSRDFPITTS